MALQSFGTLVVLYQGVPHPIMLLHHILSVLAIGSGFFRPHCGFWGATSLLCETSTMFLNFLWIVKLEAKDVAELTKTSNYGEDPGAPAKWSSPSESESKNDDITSKCKGPSKWSWGMYMEETYPTFCLFNSVALLVVFFLCRVVLFPVLLGLYLFDTIRLERAAEAVVSTASPSVALRTCVAATDGDIAACQLAPLYRAELNVIEKRFCPGVLFLMLLMSVFWMKPLWKGTKKQWYRYKEVVEGRAKKEQ